MQALCGPAAFDEVFRQGRRISNDAYSAHFALHYLKPTDSTDTQAAPALRVGFIVSKRLSKHSCRRNLIRRVWKAAIQKAQIEQKPLGTQIMVVRQRAAFDVKRYNSAASRLLSASIAQEASSLLAQWQRQIEAKPEANKP
jgi:ribonuclease P protein component